MFTKPVPASRFANWHLQDFKKTEEKVSQMSLAWIPSTISDENLLGKYHEVKQVHVSGSFFFMG